jgi:hypothetical protein
MTKLNQVTKETKYDLNQKKTQMNEVNFCLDYVGTRLQYMVPCVVPKSENKQNLDGSPLPCLGNSYAISHQKAATRR